MRGEYTENLSMIFSKVFLGSVVGSFFQLLVLIPSLKTIFSFGFFRPRLKQQVAITNLYIYGWMDGLCQMEKDCVLVSVSVQHETDSVAAVSCFTFCQMLKSK